MMNYYTIFDLDNLQVGLIGSVHVDRISYWQDILIVLCMLMAAFGVFSFAVTYYKERRMAKAYDRVERNGGN